MEFERQPQDMQLLIDALEKSQGQWTYPSQEERILAALKLAMKQPLIDCHYEGRCYRAIIEPVHLSTILTMETTLHYERERDELETLVEEVASLVGVSSVEVLCEIANPEAQTVGEEVCTGHYIPWIDGKEPSWVRLIEPGDRYTPTTTETLSFAPMTAAELRNALVLVAAFFKAVMEEDYERDWDDGEAPF